MRASKFALWHRYCKAEIRAVVFDMDGMVTDTKEWRFTALNRVLVHFGYEVSFADDLSTFYGLPAGVKQEILFKERGLLRKLHGFLNTLQQNVTIDQEHLKCNPILVYQYALSSLKACGYKLGLASNAVWGGVERMMDQAVVPKYCDVMFSDEHAKKPNPNTCVNQNAALKPGLHPEKCLVVEDAPNGIKAAEDAGCPSLVLQTVCDDHLNGNPDVASHFEERAA